MPTRKWCQSKIKCQATKGGIGSQKCPEDFDQEKVKAGMKVEREHTGRNAMACAITLDHLTEDPDYYEKLAKAGIKEHKPEQMPFPFPILEPPPAPEPAPEPAPIPVLEEEKK